MSQSAFRCDICIFEATSVGIIAALEASRLGHDVVLTSSDGHMGGLTSGGLSATDMNSHRDIGGLAREFYSRVYDYYQDPSAWREETRADYFGRLQTRVYGGVSEKERIQWVFEPKVATHIFATMLEEEANRIQIVSRVGSIVEQGAERAGGVLHSVVFEDGTKVHAKVFIDASYEGDLLASAGIAHTIGRESCERYSEELAGFRRFSQEGKVDPYRVAGQPDSGLLPLVRPYPRPEGTGDDEVQSYCFRLCLTDVAENKRPFRKPIDIDPAFFEFFLRGLAFDPYVRPEKLMTFTPIPNRKTDTNGINLAGLSASYIQAKNSERQDIKKIFREYTHGILWHLTNDGRVPVHIRREFAKWGFAKDEFANSENFPRQLYVREGRRLGSEAVITQSAASNKAARQREDAVGLATYAFDSHIVSNYVDEAECIGREGHFYVRHKGFPIPYAAFLPDRSEVQNLLTPVSISASHVAYGSIRMEPTMMCLGQSAANAASISIEQGCAVQDVEIRSLRSQLLQRRQRLTLWSEVNKRKSPLIKLYRKLADTLSRDK